VVSLEAVISENTRTGRRSEQGRKRQAWNNDGDIPARGKFKLDNRNQFILNFVRQFSAANIFKINKIPKSNFFSHVPDIQS
jgi:hypothetical protein